MALTSKMINDTLVSLLNIELLRIETARSLVPFEERLWVDVLSMKPDSLFKKVERLAVEHLKADQYAITADTLWRTKRGIAGFLTLTHRLSGINGVAARRSDTLYWASRNYSGPHFP